MICIGTSNPGKFRELTRFIAPLGIGCVGLNLDVDEPFDSLRANAVRKAQAYCRHSGMISLAEDSGLFISALGGAPGVFSARFAQAEYAPTVLGSLGLSRQLGNVQGFNRLVSQYPPERFAQLPRATVEQWNRERVLSLLHGIPPEQRSAEFRIALIVEHPSAGVVFEAHEIYRGRIATEMRGEYGFGYDAIFMGHDTNGHTIAELPKDSAHVHRKAALEVFRQWLAENRWMFTGNGEPPTAITNWPPFPRRT